MERASFPLLLERHRRTAHIHVLKDARQLKVWLSEVRVAKNIGFAAHEVNAILEVVAENRQTFLEAWNDYFGH
jgi:hypothetical protein